MLTSVPGGAIVSSVEWFAVDSPYNLAGNVQVESGATLTIQSGVQVTGSYALSIDDINTGGALSAQGANFAVKVYLDAGATANLSGNYFNGGVDTVANLASSLVGNTFPNNSTLDIQSGTIASSVFFPAISGVGTYSLDSGGLNILGG